MYIYCTSLAYLLYISCISLVYLLYISCISLVYLLYIYCISLVYLLYISCISLVYLLYISCISLVYQSQKQRSLSSGTVLDESTAAADLARKLFKLEGFKKEAVSKQLSLRYVHWVWGCGCGCGGMCVV